LSTVKNTVDFISGHRYPIQIMNEYTLLDEVGVKTNFNDWNDFQNRFNFKEYKPKRQPPKKLVNSVIQEFEEFCKNHHVNSTAYKFIEPCEIEGEWRQFDFLDNPTERYPARISVHSIVSNQNGKILQRVIDLG
jgi:hypothetical protein